MNFFDFGIITTKSETDLVDRMIELRRDVRGVLDLARSHGNRSRQVAYVVEMPAKRGAYREHLATTIPMYGMAIDNIVMAICDSTLGVNRPTILGELALLTPRADEWPWKGLPSTKGDKSKVARQEWCMTLYGVSRAELGAKTQGAGDVADAMFMADWAQTRVPQGTEIIVAFDPSLVRTGFACLEVNG